MPFDIPIDNILSQPQVMELTDLSQPTIWRMRRRGEFPAPIKLSARRIGWKASAIDQWLESRVMQP